MLAEHQDLLSSLTCGSNDDLARYSLGPQLWLRARLAVAQALSQLNHPAVAAQVCECGDFAAHSTSAWHMVLAVQLRLNVEGACTRHKETEGLHLLQLQRSTLPHNCLLRRPSAGGLRTAAQSTHS